jgi:ABC-type dipeptide/oligopeptide/nickel transport system permease component
MDALVLLWLVTTLTFALVHLAPGDPATLLIAPSATADEAAQLRTRLGLDAALPVQYGRWIAAVLQGDLGTSLVKSTPVRTVIADAFPVSLFLGGVSLLLSFALGITLGWWQALRARPLGDRVGSIASTVLFAAPGFWLALALVALFTSGVVWLDLPAWLRLPAFGMQSPAAGGDPTLADRGRHAILPLLVLTIPGAAGVARYARETLGDARGTLVVQAAIARGLSRGRVERRYILRTALTPLVVLFGLTLPGVVAGSVFVEQVFAWPGLGRALLSAIAGRDYPVVMGLTLVYGAAVIGANLLADLCLWWLDPRRRRGV